MDNSAISPPRLRVNRTYSRDCPWNDMIMKAGMTSHTPIQTAQDAQCNHAAIMKVAPAISQYEP